MILPRLPTLPMPEKKGYFYVWGSRGSNPFFSEVGNVGKVGKMWRVKQMVKKLYEPSPSSPSIDKLCPCVPISLQHAPLLISNLTGFRTHGLNEEFVRACMNFAAYKPPVYKPLKKKHAKGIRPCRAGARAEKLEEEEKKEAGSG